MQTWVDADPGNGIDGRRPWGRTISCWRSGWLPRRERLRHDGSSVLQCSRMLLVSHQHNWVHSIGEHAVISTHSVCKQPAQVRCFNS